MGVVLGFAVVVALFDWNWLRGPLERYVSGKSNREIRIDDLNVSVGLTLEPTVRLRGVFVENAPWAGSQPMAVAGEASFTFSLESVSQRRPVISRLVLRDAEIDLQRQANGLRNWRLLNPDDRGPGRIRVMTLEAHRSRIRFVHGGIDLEMEAGATPVESPAAAHTSEPLTNRIGFKGRYRGERFSGEALTGALLTFRGSGKSFPLRGHVAAGKTRAELDGSFTDVFDLAAMDAKVRIAGSTLSKLHPFVDFRPADSRPYAFEAHVTQKEQNYTIAQLQGKLGATDIAGEATYNRNGERPSLRAALRSASADLADFGSLVGVNFHSDASSRREPASAKTETSTEPPPPDRAAVGPERSGRIFPARPIRADRLRIVDAHVTMDAKRLRAADMPALGSLSLVADLTDGVLQLTPLDLGVAGGRVTGSVGFDGRQRPPSARLAIDMRDVRLEKLFPSLPAKARSAGAIDAQIRLAGEGNSIAAILGNATGSVAAVMDHGRISNLLDAKLGLDGGKILGLLIRGDRDIALNCAAVAFDFREGVGKSQTILIDTEQTHVDGTGSISLRDEQFELLLTPQPRNPGIFTLDSSIRVAGSFKHARLSVDKRVPLARGGGAAAHSKANALLRPLAQAGASPCAASLGAKTAVRSTLVTKD